MEKNFTSNNPERPLILVSNDDSYLAKGVKVLIDTLLPYGDVVAICPETPQSGKSMAITVNDALMATRLPDYHGATMYKVNGTPVDCVKLAMHTILPRPADLVCTGINHGSNSAVNVLYSGTMGAAMEGCLFGLPTIGFSLTDHHEDADFTPAIPAIKLLVEQVLKNGLPHGICLNVNIPNIKSIPQEMRICVACQGKWNDEYKEYTDPHGRKFYWLTGKYINEEPDNTLTDEWALDHGYISVVPVEPIRTPGVNTEIDWLKSLPSLYKSENSYVGNTGDTSKIS